MTVSCNVGMRRLISGSLSLWNNNALGGEALEGCARGGTSFLPMDHTGEDKRLG